MSLPYPINPNLQAVPVYQPGRPIEEVARELGLPAADIIKLASNENPLGPSRLALAAMRKALAQVNLPGRQRLLPQAKARRQTRRDPCPHHTRQRLQRSH
jgi:histidinol-phosphate/aromatic aminotransferase/cobyric acid decarboxylase-like protein